MTEQKLAKDLSSVSNEPKADEMEIDLMDILRKSSLFVRPYIRLSA